MANKLSENETSYLRNALSNVRFSDSYCLATHDGSEDSLNEIIERFLSLSSTSFIRAQKHVKEKSHKRYSPNAQPIFEHNRGNIPISFIGHPFILETSETRHCLHGSVKDSRGGRKNETSLQNQDHDECKTSYVKFQGTRKMGCPASIQIRGIQVFNEYQVDESACATTNSKKMAKKKVLDELKKDMCNAAKRLSTTMRYYVRIPLCSEHQNHLIGIAATINHCVDRRVIDKVHELVAKGVTRAEEVRRCLDEFIERELFADVSADHRPKKTNRKYYPTRQDVRNHIAKAIAASKYSKDDQESLRQKVIEWQQTSTGNFLYRPKGGNSSKKKEGSSEKFLFVHQDVWQQRLLRRYGSELALLDATYKTTKYALPLFFLCVHTNVGYKVVAEFICENEDGESIFEALQIIKGWNISWNPSYFMVDYSLAEINALEKAFPKTLVYICDFHRKQAWHRWIRSGKNGLNSNEQQILTTLLQRIAYARTMGIYNRALAELRKSPVYTTKRNVQDYVEHVWVSCAERWVQAFRKQQVLNIVNTNNGVEAQNKHFKYDYLPRTVDKSAFGIAVLLVESFIPDSHQQYKDTNFKLSSLYRTYNNDIPPCLRDRPSHFIKHCMKSKFLAGEFREGAVDCIDLECGEFRVRSSRDNKLNYTVQLQIPSCTCEAWLKTHFPCKHFYAVFNTYDDWDFSRLPPSYRNNVFITLDCNEDGPSAGDAEGDKQREEKNKTANEDGIDSDGDHLHEIEDDLENNSHDENHSANKKPKSKRKHARGDSLTLLTSLRKSIREKASLLCNAAYTVDDATCLEEAVQELDKISQSLRHSSPMEDGLPLRSSPAKKRLKETSVDYHKIFHKQLPLRRRKVRKAPNSISENNRPTFIDLTSAPESSQNQTIVTEYIDLELQTEEDKDCSSSIHENQAIPQEDSKNGKENTANQDNHVQEMDHKCGPLERIKSAAVENGKGLRDVMLEFGLLKATVGDLWTLMEPKHVTLAECQQVRKEIPSFQPGWLTDTIIDGYLRCLQRKHRVLLAGASYLSQIVRRGSSTRRTWSDVDFTNIKIIVFPVNFSGNHWTLFAIDTCSRRRLYFNPFEGKQTTSLTMSSHPSLMKHLNDLSNLVEVKTAWNVLTWPCVQPKHCHQQDGYNCGVYVCLFARCLVQGLDVTRKFNISTERKRVMSYLFGSCYDDITRGRNTAVCKVCKQDDNEDWLGCDRCGQFFHASCVGVDFASSLCKLFHCQ